MKIQIEVSIDAPKERVWRLVSDIENAAKTIGAVERIEILERPGPGMLGLKWRETRVLFGTTATETMWITEVADGDYYVAQARSHGSRYESRVFVEDKGERARLGMAFEATPETPVAKLMSLLTGFAIKGATRKALLKDFEDVKAAAEAMG